MGLVVILSSEVSYWFGFVTDFLYSVICQS